MNVSIRATLSELIHIDNLSISAGEMRLVDALSLTLRQGTPLTILGQTGSGKSLLAQAIMGLLPESMTVSGSIKVDNTEVLTLSKTEREALWGPTLAMLPQEPWHSLDPIMKSRQQVTEVFQVVNNVPAPQARARATEQLTHLGLGQALHRLPGQLSGGMAQRVAFAAATAAGGRILLADEPTKGLDHNRRDQVVELLQGYLHQGSVLTITHDIDVARKLGGELLVMCEGKIVERGNTQNVLTNPQADYTRQLLAAEPRNWPDTTAPAFKAEKDQVLSADNLGLQRGGKTLFNDLSFSLHAGEIIGVTGPSGVGKSSLGDVLLGNLKPNAGSVQYANPFTRHRRLKLYQDPPAAFAPGVPLQRLLDELMRLHRIDPSRVPPLLERLGLMPSLLHRPAESVSGGELQRIALLRILLLDPVLLFADEPTSRLDLITSQRIMTLLVEVARETECGLVIVSHDPELVEKLCDKTIKLQERQP
ncbi:ABC transporter ATP-binding protein [Saccharospirillum alexandrii]|uniref:ABC transporter ATP-binding protein n=1 Tax=Saccharospirillum alexandrii TaxID=2448477 RepID=UPI000FDBE0BE|nr:ATP-binding cassette domain-containing protein [Saccharospirillum alexandrii]